MNQEYRNKIRKVLVDLDSQRLSIDDARKKIEILSTQYTAGCIDEVIKQEPMRAFDEIIENATLKDLMNQDGKVVLHGLCYLASKYKVSKTGNEVSNEILEILTGKSWIAGMLSLVYCLDVLIQSIKIKGDKLDKELKNMIDELESKMRKGENNGKRE